MSLDSFERHVEPTLRLVRLGRMRLVPIAELTRWLDDHAERTVEGAASSPASPRTRTAAASSRSEKVPFRERACVVSRLNPNVPYLGGSMKRRVILASAVAGVLSIAAPPASADPPVFVADCPTDLVCKGRVVVIQCVPDRNGISFRCEGDANYSFSSSGKALFVAVGTHGREAVGHVGLRLESLTDGDGPRIEWSLDPRGVSFSIDTDDKPRQPCPRCDGGS